MFGAGDVRVVDVPDAKIIAQTDAVVRVVRACICGSDLHPFHSKPAGTVGQAMGHEAIGIVEEIGAEVKSIARGDFVIVPFGLEDNTCVFCREGVQTSCVNGSFLTGAQAEAVRVSQADGSLVKVPGVGENADEDLLGSLLALSDVYLTGWHAAHMGRVEPGKTVTVIGDGAVGLSSVLAAHRMGAEKIILMGRHEARTNLGREWGATDVVAARGNDGVAAVMEITGGEGSHIVLEAVGHMPAYEQAYRVVRPGGVISRVGVPQYQDAPIGFASLFGKNVTLTGGPAPVRAYIDHALPDVLAGLIEPGKVFDVTVGLEGVPGGYAAMNAREALKVMINPSLERAGGSPA